MRAAEQDTLGTPPLTVRLGSARYTFSGDHEVIVGRGVRSDTCFDGPDTQWTSQIHLVLRFDGAQWVAFDRSLNGIFVNGVRRSAVEIPDGNAIALGGPCEDGPRLVVQVGAATAVTGATTANAALPGRSAQSSNLAAVHRWPDEPTQAKPARPEPPSRPVEPSHQAETGWLSRRSQPDIPSAEPETVLVRALAPRNTQPRPGPRGRPVATPPDVTQPVRASFGTETFDSPLTVWVGPARYTFFPGRDIFVGRSPTSGICLDSPDSRWTSHTHVVLRHDGTNWVAIDRSRNGTYLDGVRLPIAEIRDGRAISLGHPWRGSRLFFQLTASADTGAAAEPPTERLRTGPTSRPPGAAPESEPPTEPIPLPVEESATEPTPTADEQQHCAQGDALRKLISPGAAGDDRREDSPRRLAWHTWMLTGRLLRRWRRDLTTVLESLIMPVALLVTLNIVLGDGISQVTGHSALYGSVPLIAMVGAMSGSMVGGVGLMREHEDGLLSRLWVLPVHRAAGLLSRLSADVVRIVVTTAVILGAGLALGFRFQQGILASVAWLFVPVAFGIAFTMVVITIALYSANTIMVEATEIIWGLLMFFSTGFVPLEQYPHWIQPVVRHQPMSYAVEVMRGLSLGGRVFPPTIAMLLWSAGVAAACAVPMAIGYRRACMRG